MKIWLYWIAIALCVAMTAWFPLALLAVSHSPTLTTLASEILRPAATTEGATR